MKFKRIYQSLFYLIQYQDREGICEDFTNKFSWIKSRKFFKINIENVMDDNVYKYMSQYNPFGPKDGEYKSY